MQGALCLHLGCCLPVSTVHPDQDVQDGSRHDELQAMQHAWYVTYLPAPVRPDALFQGHENAVPQVLLVQFKSLRP